MKRVDIDKEMRECVANGFYCMSNAMEHNLQKGVVNPPQSNDWSYYWAVENVDDEKYLVCVVY